MRYLFFDIECSEGKSMCSFGYVLTDEKFRILEKDDFVVEQCLKFIKSALKK